MSDEQKINAHITITGPDEVMVTFGQPVAYLRLSLAEVRDLANALLKTLPREASKTVN